MAAKEGRRVKTDRRAICEKACKVLRERGHEAQVRDECSGWCMHGSSGRRS